MRALITGITGFVGRYLAAHLLKQGFEVYGTTRREIQSLSLGEGITKLYRSELTNTLEIVDLLEATKPDFIFHLAGQSNVKKSWDNKEFTFYANVNKTIFLLDACLTYTKRNPHCRILTIGSSEEYGNVNDEDLPITEDVPVRPISPYGASKAAVSMLVRQYVKADRLEVIHVRPFNHIGPGQSLGFLLPDLASQIVKIEKGLSEPILKVGNLEAIRDFTDVRDIVVAYSLIAQYGKPGEIYNVCSGVGRSVRDLLYEMLKLSHKKIEIELDPNRLRPSEIPMLVGSNQKIRHETKWTPSIPMEQSLMDILNDFRKLSSPW